MEGLGKDFSVSIRLAFMAKPMFLDQSIFMYDCQRNGVRELFNNCTFFSSPDYQLRTQ